MFCIINENYTNATVCCISDSISLDLVSFKVGQAMLETTPKSRPKGRSERIGEAVKEATLALLVERGLSGVTLEQVATLANVNRTTLYRRWGDKTRLIVWALLEEVGAEVPYGDFGSLRVDLLHVLRGVNEFLGTRLARAILPVMFENSDDEIGEALSSFWQGRHERMTELLDRAQARGDIPDSCDREFLVDKVFGPVYLHHIMGRGVASDDYLVQLVEDLVI